MTGIPVSDPRIDAAVGEGTSIGPQPTPSDVPDPKAVPRSRRPLLELVGPFAVFALFVGFWYFMSYVGMSPQRRFLVPPPHEVVQVAFFDWGNLQPMLEALWLSTRVALTGLAIAIVLGMGIAILMSQAKWVERSLFPYAVALQAVPILAFVPLIGVIFGFNFRARVIVVVIIAIFPIIANTLFGLLSADKAQHELFTLHGASRFTRMWRLQLPAAMPAIFAGFRISAGLAVIGAVVGDFFFRQGQPGIGVLIDIYRARLRNPEMYGAVILAALLGILVFWFFGWLSNRVVGHWHESTRKTG
jgi:NitT/TauT family transport system permease protein